jgi:hypothetical protein
MLRHRLAPALSLACLTLVGCAGTAPTGPRPTPETAALDKSPLPSTSWTARGSRTRAARGARRQEAGGARNVIFFLGDGMGISTVTAARILAGQQLGGPGEDHSLSFDNFPNGPAQDLQRELADRGLGGHDERHDDRRENRHWRFRCR